MTPILPLPLPWVPHTPLIQDITSLIVADSHINFPAWCNVEPDCQCFTPLHAGETATQ